MRRMDGLWCRQGKGTSVPGDGARGKDFELAGLVKAQVSPLQCHSQLFLLCLHKGNSTALGGRISAQSPALVGTQLLGSGGGEEQLQNVSSHAVYLLRASFSDTLMNERAVKNKCLIV